MVIILQFQWVYSLLPPSYILVSWKALIIMVTRLLSPLVVWYRSNQLQSSFSLLVEFFLNGSMRLLLGFGYRQNSDARIMCQCGYSPTKHARWLSELKDEAKIFFKESQILWEKQLFWLNSKSLNFGAYLHKSCHFCNFL